MQFPCIMRTVTSVSILVALVSLTASAGAEPARAHGALVGAGAALGPQASEFGPGGGGFAALEIPLGRRLGLEAEVGGILLAPGEGRAGYSTKGVGTLVTAMGGARFRFFGRTPAGPWIGGHAGAGVTGDRVRFTFDGELGWDFRVGHGRFDVGPFAGYLHVYEPDGGLAPEDAHVFVAGIAISLGAPTIALEDLDHDGIVDTEDACPTEPGPRTSDPRTNGCPIRDRDRDNVVDAEDACPTVPGIRTRDVTTNGCPPVDHDDDGIPDVDDACPADAGARTPDPKTNGCPADRDHDGIPDDVDACPDLVGAPSSDPKINGCPPPKDGVEVIGDRIFVDDVINFDTDSARVHRESVQVLKRLADMLNHNLDIIEVYVEGHTDQTGPADWNQQLSDDRAASVKKLLVSFGVAESRIVTHGWGFSRPRNIATTPDALRENRRVEFIITRTSTAPGGIQ